MRHRASLGSLAFALAIGLGAEPGCAQAMLADDIVILRRGSGSRRRKDDQTQLGRSPEPEKAVPGQPRRRRSPARRAPGGPSLHFDAAARRALRREQRGPGPPAGPAARIAPPARQPSQGAPIYGPLEVPAGTTRARPNGLTLDPAIERLSRRTTASAPSSRRSPRPRPTSSPPDSGPTRSSSPVPIASLTATTRRSGRGRTATASS